MRNKLNLGTHRGAFTRLAAAALAIALLNAPALAWGDEGHRIVARIAEQNLSPAVRQRVADILLKQKKNNPCHGSANVLDAMLCAATWPDTARNTTHPETYNWHFVDISLRNDDYEKARDCEPADQAQKGKCGIFGLDRALEILRGAPDPKISQAQALMFVVHIVGDLHQPLHTVKERIGGNTYYVEYFDVATQLHKVWDTKIIETRMKKLHKDEAGYAQMLEDGIASAGGLASLQQGTPVEWLTETHAAAIADAYECPAASDCGTAAKWLRNEKWADNTRRQIGKTYYDHNVTVVERQLRRAGARLAKILDEALG